MQALSLRFASIDICAVRNNLSGPSSSSDIEIDASGEGLDMMVMEANSNVNTKWYLTQHPQDWDLVKRIYKDAVLSHFKAQAAQVIANALWRGLLQPPPRCWRAPRSRRTGVLHHE